MVDRDYTWKGTLGDLSRAEKKTLLVNLLRRTANLGTGLDPQHAKHSFADEAKFDFNTTPIGGSVVEVEPKPSF
jgi:hypothetical protein